MTDNLIDTEWALGLYAYTSDRPAGAEFQAFHDIVVEVFTQAGAAPTHIAVEGEGHTGRAVKFGGTASRKLADSGFEGIMVLDLTATPKGSDAPGYDRIVSASLSFTPPGEVLLCLTMNEGLERLGGDLFRETVDRLVALRDWSFGMAFADTIDRQPDFHVLGIDNGRLSPDDQAALNAWYGAPPEKKTSMVRGVYPVLLLNPEQRRQPVSGGRSLAEYLEAEGVPVEVRRGDLMMVSIPPEKLEPIRAALAGGGVLIT
ncbi:MAG: hypothetical protein AAF492_04860 [Verrucomicrobiota bacterium]